jgi:hypothetical protein
MYFDELYPSSPRVAGQNFDPSARSLVPDSVIEQQGDPDRTSESLARGKLSPRPPSAGSDWWSPHHSTSGNLPLTCGGCLPPPPSDALGGGR